MLCFLIVIFCHVNIVLIVNKPTYYINWIVGYDISSLHFSSSVTVCYNAVCAGDQVVLQLGPSIQTQMWMTELQAVHQQCPIVSLSATIILAVPQWTGSLVSQ